MTRYLKDFDVSDANENVSEKNLGKLAKFPYEISSNIFFQEHVAELPSSTREKKPRAWKGIPSGNL